MWHPRSFNRPKRRPNLTLKMTIFVFNFYLSNSIKQCLYSKGKNWKILFNRKLSYVAKRLQSTMRIWLQSDKFNIYIEMVNLKNSETVFGLINERILTIRMITMHVCIFRYRPMSILVLVYNYEITLFNNLLSSLGKYLFTCSPRNR